MSVRRELVRLLILLVALASAVAPSPAEAPEKVSIGVVMDGPWERNAAVRSLFEKEIRDILAGELDVRFPEASLIVADHSLAGVRAALDRLYADPRLDVVLALGPLASHEASRRTDHPVPTFAPFVIDRKVQELPVREGTSGVDNLNYLDVYSAPQRNIEVFRELTEFDSIAVLVSESIVAAIPRLAENLRAFLGQLDLAFWLVPVSGSADDVLAGIPAEAEAAYVTPLLTLSPGELERLAEGLIERRIPSFALWGPEPVESGLLFTLTPETFLPRLSRRVALNVQRVLLGENAGTLAYTFARDERLIINMATARAVGAWPRWETLTEAELLNEEPALEGDPLTLSDAVREAIRANLDLAARARAVEAGREEIRRARSSLRPQLDVFASEVVVDEDRAAASFGSQAERTFEIGASYDQLVFSEPALANVTIQKRLQEARELDRGTLSLDITVLAARAYLNVLRTRTFERIQKDDLKRTRSNLELARVRREIGFSGPSEVYRWESEVAQARIAVREAEAQRRVADLELNRVLHRPAEHPVNTVEADIEHRDL
ncbi:MAG: TolC family protein, partial [Acidobacteriota bacterium]|nr:TolC family protein [Acidobacteriota bacterium]